MVSKLLTPSRLDLDRLHEATALYTVTTIVNGLLDRLQWPQCGGTLLDPSAGNGSFLIEALKRLDVRNVHQLSRIKGWEIHPGAADDACRAVSEFLNEHGYSAPHARQYAQQMIFNKDFLTAGPSNQERFDVIAGNPPYLCYRRLPEYFKRLYSVELPHYARADLLNAFLDSCTKLITPNGHIGLVCSDRFLINDTTSELRKRLGQRVGISHLARLDQRSAFYRPKRRVKNSPPRIHPVEIIFSPARLSLIPITASPISPDSLTRHPHPTSSERTLSDIASIKLAPWLGPEGIFVIDAAAALHLRDHAELIPAVDTDDIDRVDDTLKPSTRFIIKTSSAVQPSAEITRHLEGTLSRMPARGRRSIPWLPPELPSLPLDQPSLLIPRIARRLRVINLPPGVMPINHNLSIVTTGQIPLADIKALLLSDKSQHWIAANCPRLENGYLSITTKRLRRLPI